MTIEKESKQLLQSSFLTFVINSFIGIMILATVFIFTIEAFYIPYYWLLDVAQVYVLYRFILQMLKNSVVNTFWQIIKNRILKRSSG